LIQKGILEQKLKKVLGQSFLRPNDQSDFTALPLWSLDLLQPLFLFAK
jgi:hypothetical protein